MTEEVKQKVEAEANWRSTDGHGAVNETTKHNFTEGVKYGYHLRDEEVDQLKKEVERLSKELEQYKFDY